MTSNLLARLAKASYELHCYHPESINFTSWDELSWVKQMYWSNWVGAIAQVIERAGLALVCTNCRREPHECRCEGKGAKFWEPDEVKEDKPNA